MARVRLNPILEQVRGQVGDLVFKRSGDSVILSRKPDFSERQPTPAQAVAQERFRQAALYGKMVMADPQTKQLYEQAAKAKGRPLFSLTVADFFNTPSIDEVDLAGYTGQINDQIIIRAHDDFEVSAVNVALSNAAGDPLESGQATESPPKSGRWVYTATTAVATGTQVRINVTVADRPGGTGSSESEKAV
jgi:hypothetical protein